MSDPYLQHINNQLNKIELSDPKQIIEVTDKITVEAKCNDCQSDNIAVIVKRIPIDTRSD